MNTLMWTATTCAQHGRDGLRFASDLIDVDWAVIEPLLPPSSEVGPVGRPPECNLTMGCGPVSRIPRPAFGCQPSEMVCAGVRASCRSLFTRPGRPDPVHSRPTLQPPAVGL